MTHVDLSIGQFGAIANTGTISIGDNVGGRAFDADRSDQASLLTQGVGVTDIGAVANGIPASSGRDARIFTPTGTSIPVGAWVPGGQFTLESFPLNVAFEVGIVGRPVLFLLPTP